MLDATVGGHVEIGDSYEQTAIKETEEETGMKIKAGDLILIGKIKRYSEDKATGRINNVINTRYALVYRGDIKGLRIEAGEALGFEAWSIDKLLNLTVAEKAKFISQILHFVTTEFPPVMADVIKK